MQPDWMDGPHLDLSSWRSRGAPTQAFGITALLRSACPGSAFFSTWKKLATRNPSSFGFPPEISRTRPGLRACVRARARHTPKLQPLSSDTPSSMWSWSAPSARQRGISNPSSRQSSICRPYKVIITHGQQNAVDFPTLLHPHWTPLYTII